MAMVKNQSNSCNKCEKSIVNGRSGGLLVRLCVYTELQPGLSAGHLLATTPCSCHLSPAEVAATAAAAAASGSLCSCSAPAWVKPCLVLSVSSRLQQVSVEGHTQLPYMRTAGNWTTLSMLATSGTSVEQAAVAALIRCRHTSLTAPAAVLTAKKVGSICAGYAAAAGDQHCLLLDSSGCIWTMGSNRHGQLGLSTAQQAAAAGVASSAHSLAASRDRDPAAGCQQEQQISGFAAVLGPGTDSNVQEPVRQVSATHPGGCDCCLRQLTTPLCIILG
jgi:hypothetical protein